MTTTNTTAPVTPTTTTTTTTAMAAWHTSLPDHVMWIPYFAIACLLALVLGISFRRHHMRHVKKKQYAMEYQEKNLSARRPRISGKLNIIFNRVVTPSDFSAVPYVCPESHPPEIENVEMSKSEHSYHTLNTDDMLFSVDPEFPMNSIRGGIKKRFKSAHDISDTNQLYRQISEDEYFRRKGPRESFYLKSGKERHLFPNGKRQRVADFDMMARSFWIESDDHRHGQTDMGGNRGAVKYIKVFNLDLCTDCRMYVERVDVSASTVSSLHASVNSDVSPSEEKLCVHARPDGNLLQTLPTIPDIPPEVSIAEVHSQLPFSLQLDANSTRTTNNEPLCQDVQQLSPFQCERPRSAPDLLKGEQDVRFSLDEKTKSEECIASLWNEAETMNSRL